MDVKEKQGHLGDLSTKTIPQLQELLDRDNNILKNIKFIDKLPDKGQKIQKLAKQLEAELQSRMEVDSTADLINKMSLQPGEENAVNDEKSCEEQNILEYIINRPSEKKIVVKKEENVSEPGQFINSYENVIKKAERKQPSKKFYPHKSLKSNTKTPSLEMEVSKDVVSLDEPPPLESPPLSTRQIHASSENETMQMGDSPLVKSETGDITAESKDSFLRNVQNGPTETGGKDSLKHKYDESLEASNFRPTKFEKAKLISVEESVNLIQAQREQQEKLQASHAAQRLAERMGVKMVDYEPKEVQMRYRNPHLSDSEASSDSEENEIDYPD